MVSIKWQKPRSDFSTNRRCLMASDEDFFFYSIEYRVKKGEFRVIKVEYRVIKVEYRVIKVEYRVMKVEYRVIKVECQVIKSEYRVIKSEYRVIKSEYRVIKSEYRVIKQNKKTIGCSTRSHTWRSHGIKKTYLKNTRQIDMVKIKKKKNCPYRLRRRIKLWCQAFILR